MHPTAPRVLAFVQNPPMGSDLWRVMGPVTALQAARYPADWAFVREPTLRLGVADYDVYLIPRMAWQTRAIGEAWFRDARRAGKVVIFDCDDAIFGPEETERRVRLDWTDGKSIAQLERERADRIWTLNQTDGCTVSTEALAEHVRQYTDKPVITVPNCLDLPWFRSVLVRSERTVPGLTIGWAGGRRSDDDVAPMAEAWGRIARRYPAVTFVVQGWQPAVIAEHVTEDRIVRLPWLPLQDYPAGLVNVDIGCCPLAPTPFNRAKSPIKAWEYAAAGAAVVASPTVYGDALTDGHDTVICRDADEWQAALERLICDQWMRQRMARRLLKRVERDHTLAKGLGAWPTAWSRIVASARLRGVA